MRLVSVNVALPKPIHGTARGTVLSGIYKQPVAEAVAVRTLGIEGDGVGDPVNHGGARMAVYVYDADDYLYWRDQGLSIEGFGWFGENLTIEGASSDSVCLGDVWQVGETTLQVTEPRSPCYKLEHKVGIPHFAATFQRSGRVGFYLRVLNEGRVAPDTGVELVSRDADPITVRELSDYRHYGTGGLATAKRVLGLEDVGRAWTRRARKAIAPPTGSPR